MSSCVFVIIALPLTKKSRALGHIMNPVISMERVWAFAPTEAMNHNSKLSIGMERAYLFVFAVDNRRDESKQRLVTMRTCSCNNS